MVCKVKEKITVWLTQEEALGEREVKEHLYRELEEIVAYIAGPRRLEHYLDWALSLWG